MSPFTLSAWFVGIGEDATGLCSTGFVVPNGFCYAKACLTEVLKTSTGNKGANMGKLVKDPNMANPVTASSRCGQAQSACADIAGYAAATGRTAPSKWDGKEWPVPERQYAENDDPNDAGVAAGLLLAPTKDGANAYSMIPAFRGPVF